VSSIQFYISRRVAAAIDFPAIRAAASAVGVLKPPVVCRDLRGVPGKTRVACTPEAAVLLIDQIRGIASAAEAYGDSKMLVACANAITVASKAIDEDRAKPPDEGTMRYLGPSPN
jgi:hypothetical protein